MKRDAVDWAIFGAVVVLMLCFALLYSSVSMIEEPHHTPPSAKTK